MSSTKHGNHNKYTFIMKIPFVLKMSSQLKMKNLTLLQCCFYEDAFLNEMEWEIFSTEQIIDD